MVASKSDNDPPFNQIRHDEDSICLAVGKAIMEWAALERILAHAFGLASRTDPLIADAIFFSARAFKGKHDMMLSAILASQKRNPSDVEFARLNLFKAALKKTKSWEVVRNRLAHNNISTMKVEDKYIGGVVSPQKYGVGYLQNTLTEAAITEAAVNFRDLLRLVARGISSEDKERLEALRETILLLPNPPYSHSVENLLRDAGV